jgi:hypothetical protein
MAFTSEPGITEAMFQAPQPAQVVQDAYLTGPWPPPAVSAATQAWQQYETGVLGTAHVTAASLWNIAHSWAGW